MFQLILTIISIALISALVMVSMSYVNPKVKRVQDASKVAVSALTELAEVYSLTTKLSDGVPPPADLSEDGGFSANFKGYLKFEPKVMPGYSLAYGKMYQTTDVYSELNYFCVHPTNSSISVEDSLDLANRIKAEMPEGQVLLAVNCANPLNAYTSTTSAPALIYFVRYIPKE